MSKNHDNVTWQSADGTWSIGFYAEDYLDCGGNEEECGDETHEWCRQFDHDRFQFVSCGHASENDAHRAWPGVNPGSSTSMHPYTELSAAGRSEIDALDDMAAQTFDRYAAEEAERHRTGERYYARWHGVSEHGAYGTPKRRTAAGLHQDHLTSLRNHWSSRLGGNEPNPETLKRLKAQKDAKQTAIDALPAQDPMRERIKGSSAAFHNWLEASAKSAQEREDREAAARRRLPMPGYMSPAIRADSLRRVERSKRAKEAIEAALAAVTKSRATPTATSASPKKASPAKKAAAKKSAPTTSTTSKAAAKKTPAAATGARTRRKDTGRPGNGGRFDHTPGARSSASLTPPQTAGPTDPWAGGKVASEDASWLAYDG